MGSREIVAYTPNMIRAYYNDNDPKVCAWLRELIARGLIAPGDVDDRSIADVQPDDLTGYTQCHFFAGIGGWSYALRLAGWPDDRPVWTGSCPCQPFSDAGSRGAERDERHLWPELYRLIADARPPVCFGEQVASSDGRAWLGGVRADLDALGYAVGSADLCAAGVGAPHIRQRLWWVADAGCEQAREGRVTGGEVGAGGETGPGSGVCGTDDGMADAGGERRSRHGSRTGQSNSANLREDSGLEHAAGTGRTQGRAESDGGIVAGGCGAGRLDDASGARTGPEHARSTEPSGDGTQDRIPGQTGPWADSELIPCGDGKARRIEPGLAPLAHGIPARVVRLRGYGNAIVPQVAAEFIGAYMDCEVPV